MWIFTSQAFVSIVEDETNQDNLFVRARFKGDLEHLFPGEKIATTPRADYRFRVSVSREKVMRIVLEQIKNIDYFNFKNTVPQKDRYRHDAYLRVWSAMYSAQQESVPRRRRRRKRLTQLVGEAPRHPRMEDWYRARDAWEKTWESPF